MKQLLYFHTLRYLRPVQIAGRLWRLVYRPGITLEAPPPLRSLSGAWHTACERSSLMLDANTFRFLNVTGSLQSVADWDDPGRLRHWRYNLHYFDDLNAHGASARAGWHNALISRWIEDNRPGIGTGWEPYPTSLRIVNWIKWTWCRKAQGVGGLDARALDSLACQVRWLSRNMEVHLLGNHLWANAKALVFAGAFFDGPEAGRWLKNGLALLERELHEQILLDGGHFERSPMYHAIVLEDVLDVINLASVAPDCFSTAFPQRLRIVAADMLHWLRVMSHPDGGIALFNDAAFEIAPDHEALAGYAARLGVPFKTQALKAVEALPDSGYIRLQNDRAVVICDIALVGPDYLPGHAHADTLSFELSLDGQRVLVNGGTSTYEPDAERQRQRSSPAHNTVTVDGMDSSEVWGGFRVARRARVFAQSWGVDGARLWLQAAHDGYRRLPGKIVHHRRWVLENTGLAIEDNLQGDFTTATTEWHLYPGLEAKKGDDGSIIVSAASAAGKKNQISFVTSAQVAVQATTWHPEFGLSMDNISLTTDFQGQTHAMRLQWQ